VNITSIYSLNTQTFTQQHTIKLNGNHSLPRVTSYSIFSKTLIYLNTYQHFFSYYYEHVWYTAGHPSAKKIYFHILVTITMLLK